MHGYDPAENPEMLGFFVLTRWGATTPGRDVGPLDSLRIHPTVAKLLGIEPAEGATGTAARCRRSLNDAPCTRMGESLFSRYPSGGWR